MKAWYFSNRSRELHLPAIGRMRQYLHFMHFCVLRTAQQPVNKLIDLFRCYESISNEHLVSKQSPGHHELQVIDTVTWLLSESGIIWFSLETKFKRSWKKGGVTINVTPQNRSMLMGTVYGGVGGFTTPVERGALLFSTATVGKNMSYNQTMTIFINVGGFYKFTDFIFYYIICF